MKILLTGASGQLGQAIQACCQEQGITYEAYSHQQLDIADSAAVLAICFKAQPTIVINAAAYTAVDKAEQDYAAAFKVNADGPKHLAMACEMLSIPLLHFSTDYVFDGEKGTAYNEDDLAAPVNVYGETKWLGEELVRSICKRHLIIRTSWIYGAAGANFVKTILRLASQKDELKIVADQFGSPTSAKSLAEASLLLVTKAQQNDALWGTYHFCNAGETSWFDFAKEIVRLAKDNHENLTEKIFPIVTKDYPLPAKRPKLSALACDKIEKVLQMKRANWQEELAANIRDVKI